MPKIVQQFYRVLRFFLNTIVVVTFGTMFAMCLTQVFCRFVLQSPISFSDELCRTCFFLATFYACALRILDKGHIKVDMLYLKFTGATKKVFDLIIGFSIIFFSYFLVKSGYEFALANTGSVTSSLSIPLEILYMNIPISGVVMILCEIKVLWEDVFLSEKKTSESEGDAV